VEDDFQDENCSSDVRDPDLNHDKNTNCQEQFDKVQGGNLNNEPSNNTILSFLREDEMTESEMNWLNVHGTLN
jgi:hypothetical protein